MVKILRITAVVLLFSLVFSLFGCQNVNTPKPDTDSIPAPKPNDGMIDIGQEELPYSEEQLYRLLFDPENKIEIDLDMDEAELAKLQSDHEHYSEIGSKSPIYRKGDVCIRITTGEDTIAYRIPEVGIRMKGNTSRTSFYDGDRGIYRYIHLRLDFQETFDDPDHYGQEAKVWENEDLRLQRKERTFATLEKLELRWNKNYDATYLREAYAYEVYRSEGLLAPQCTLGALTWNSTGMGVYTIEEPIDKVFLSKNLPEKDLDGDLYKCGWTYTGATFTSQKPIGIENEDNGEFYVYDLKTNKKTSQHEALKGLLTGLNNGAVTKESFARLVDVDYFLRYCAVSYFLGNPDDLRNNYNNCYLYFLKSTGKAIIIPYDYDRCLGITVDYNPSGHAMTRENPFSERCEGMQNGPQEQESPLFIYSVDKGGFYVREFAQVLEQVAQNELFQPESFEARFNIAAALYGNDVTPERKLENADGRDFRFDLNKTDSASGGSNMSFKDYIQAKMSTFRSYMNNLDQYADYVRPVPATFFIRGDFNDWSNRDEYGMEAVDGKMVYTLTFNREFAFKVYDNVNQEWYGTDFFPEETDLDFRTNDHDNVILRPGTYQVVFDPETLILTVTKQ